MNILAAIALTLVLAFVTESMIEYLFGQAAERIPVLKPYSWLLMYLAAIVGVGLALYYQIDLVSILANQAGYSLAMSPVGMVISGLVIGRGANFASDFLARYLQKQTSLADLATVVSTYDDDDEDYDQDL